MRRKTLATNYPLTIWLAIHDTQRPLCITASQVTEAH
jgi:hypothetical protein